MSYRPPPLRSLQLCLGLLLYWLTIPSASGHPLAPSLLDISEQEDSVVATLKLYELQRGSHRPYPSFPESCLILDSQELRRTAGSVWTRYRLRCDGSLAGKEIHFRQLAVGGGDVVVRVQLLDGRRLQGLSNAEAPVFRVPMQQSGAEVASRYGQLGFSHLFEGLDHVLFVVCFALLLARARASSGRIAGGVTAFTVGHSATLALGGLDVLRLPSAPIEIGIALSVVWLGHELATGRSLTARYPWALGFSFGLVHGMGFAGALRSIELTSSELVVGLLGFNLGLELGQLVLLGGVLALALLLTAAGWRKLMHEKLWIAAYPIGCPAAYLAVERIAALFGI